jgi:hypothetical protein
LFAVTVAESLRFLPIREKIGTILESGTIGYLDETKYNDYINNWAKISMLLLCSLHGRPLGDFRGYNALKKSISWMINKQSMSSPLCYGPVITIRRHLVMIDKWCNLARDFSE